MEIEVTTTPVKLADSLGIDPARLAALGTVLLWTGVVENFGPENVHLRRYPTAPDPAAVIGSRILQDERRQLAEYSGTPFGGHWWVWTLRGASRLLAEMESPHG